MNTRIVFLLCIMVCQLSYSQTSMDKISNLELAEKDSIVSLEVGDLIINNDIKMPEDSLETKALLASLNGFLSSAYKNTQNDWILPSQIVETQILVDELQYIPKSEAFENDSFFKAYITNIIPIEAHEYLIKISYIGIHNDSPILRASFELIANQEGDRFLIASPLQMYTENWKTKKIQNHIFHYPFTIDDNKAQKFVQKVIFYDEKLNNNTGEYHYYLLQDGIDPAKLFGVEYKADYNGYELKLSWESQHDNKTLYVANESRVFEYDTHDLWHSRLRRIIPRNEIHRRVDCHIATLYGGIWGFSWDELFPLFYKKFALESNVDWLAHKANKSHFITDGIRGERKNYTDDFVGALLIKSLSKIP